MISHITPLADWVVILPVLLCLIGGALLLMLRSAIRAQLWICLGVLVLVLVCDGILFNRVLAGGPLSMTMGKWLPPFGISFTVDVMGAGFALMAAFVTFCVVLAMQAKIPEGPVRDGAYPLILLLLAGVTGSFLTGDLFNLYVWFEVMLIASFGLIILAGNPLQLDGAVKYGVLNFIATTLFLVALGLLYGTLGTLNMADIIGAAKKADPALLTAIAALFALAFGMKAAVFPVNAWLPASYHAPPAAISALFGGLLTKVGVYAFIRVMVMLLPAARDILAPTITTIAIATMILGPLSAIAETNLRRSIGFLLMGGVGIAICCVPNGHLLVIFGGVSYISASMLIIAGLYLAAGVIETLTGTTDTREMGGIYSAKSLISIVFFTLILAVAGIPPFLGFWPKLLLLQGFVTYGNWLLVLSILLNSLLTLIAGTRLWSHIFWKPRAEQLQKAQGMGGTVLIAGTIVLLGLFPSLLLKAASVAATELLDPSSYIIATGLSP